MYINCSEYLSIETLNLWGCSSVSTWSHQVDDNVIRGYLNISSAEVEDGGLYCCSVQNQNPSIQLDGNQVTGSSSNQHCARLNVYGNSHYSNRYLFECVKMMSWLFCFIDRSDFDPLGGQQDGHRSSRLLSSLSVRWIPHLVHHVAQSRTSECVAPLPTFQSGCCNIRLIVRSSGRRTSTGLSTMAH